MFRHTVIVRTKRRRDMYDTRTILCRNEITRDHTECTFTRIYPWINCSYFIPANSEPFHSPTTLKGTSLSPGL